MNQKEEADVPQRVQSAFHKAVPEKVFLTFRHYLLKTLLKWVACGYNLVQP